MYRLAPTHQFPIPVHDSYDALKWALAHSAELNATPTTGLIVGGASAGGNIAAVLALLSKDEGLEPVITGQYLCVPALIPDANSIPLHLAGQYESWTSSVDDPVLKDLPPGLIEEIYGPDLKSSLWDPFNAAQGHGGLAKAFFQVGGIDPLRDGAVMYDRVLREAGVLTRFELYSGFGHMFWTNYPEMEESEGFVADTLKGVKWLLEK